MVEIYLQPTRDNKTYIHIHFYCDIEKIIQNTTQQSGIEFIKLNC